MNNTDYFRITTFNLAPSNKAGVSKEKTIQRPKKITINTSKAIQSLLEGSSKSHCNTFVRYSRIPHKYDHFHEKTLPSSVVGSFINSLSPIKPEPQKSLLALSESSDVRQARQFYHKQKIFDKVFDVGRLNRAENRRKK